MMSTNNPRRPSPLGRGFIIAFLAIMSSVSSYGQFRNTVVITANGNVDMSSWIIPTGDPSQRDFVQIVLEEADPSQVFLAPNMTGTIYWGDKPDGHPTPTNATLMPALLPGTYGVSGNEGKILPQVNYISWPWLYKNGVKWQQLKLENNGTFTADAGDVIDLELPTFFAGGGGVNALFFEGNHIGGLQSSYTLTSTGNYELRTDDGTTAPMNIRNFRLEFQSTTVAVTGVTLNQTSLTRTAGDSPVTLSATIAPSTATNQAVTWQSSNPSVASVNSSGVVSFAGAGTATITVTTADGNHTATCTVTVNSATVSVAGVTLNKATTTLTVGNTETLTATVAPSNATNQSVTWSSSNAAVASVDATGKVTAHTAGTATITITTADGNHTASCTVTVNSATISVAGVTLNKATTTLTIGNTETLTATVAPTNATNQAMTWTSSNSAVASVNSTGTITAHALGAATITVTTTDGNKTATCAVTVVSDTPPPPVIVPATGVSLKPSTALVVGGTETLTATVAPTNATDKTVGWTSSDPTVASIDANGKLTALKAGQTTITATTTDGGFAATCVVTVSIATVPVSSVSLNKNTLELHEGEDDNLTAIINPTTATNRNVSWKSSNIAVATVNANGKVMAINAGTAIITVTTSDGNKTATCTVTVKRDDVSNAAPADNSFRAYPNPTDGIIIVTGLPAGQQLMIYTLSGTQISIHPTTSDGKMEINLSPLPKGTYILKTATETVKVMRK